MARLVFTILFTAFPLIFAQTWLDPSNFPSFGTSGWCDTSGKIAAYESLYRGQSSAAYKIGTGYPDPTTGTGGADYQKYYAPVIDGDLRDSIVNVQLWQYAETLMINSWEDAGFDDCCNDPSPDFTGAHDLHAIWRFMYNHDGLYVSCEVHDDIHDVDSLAGWYLQDGLEIGITPWDWGDFAAGNWSATTNIFRRYVSNNQTPIPGGGVGADNSQYCFLHLLKRLNDEPYITGWIRTKYLHNYDRGDEATNFVLGKLDLHGIEFAIADHGVDPWFRQIHHAEFKFPYHGTLWQELDDMGGYFNATGLPIAGTRLKMDFVNNDDDVLGPNGSIALADQMLTRRSEPFAQEPSGHDHWSDTKYFPTFMYDASYRTGVPVLEGDASHGDPRIAGVWVEAPAELARANFTVGGYAELWNNVYFYDSTSAQGGVVRDRQGTQAATYRLAWSGVKSYHDTLYVNNASYGNLVLLRLLTLGFKQIEGRWVESRPDSVYNAFCGRNFPCFTPVAGAKEYRFSPLSGVDTNLVAGFKGCSDSVRVFDYETGGFLYEYAYTDKEAVSGRGTVHFTYEQGPVKIIYDHDTLVSRQMIIRFPSGDTALLNEIKPYPLSWLGATGNNANQRITLLNEATSGDSLWKLYIFDKYRNKVLCYHELNVNTNRTFVTLYPDMVLCTDSSKHFFWEKMFGCAFYLDSFRLVGYDSASGTAAGIAEKGASPFWPDSSWILQEHYLRVWSGHTLDQFSFRDTTHVIHWDYTLQDPARVNVFNAIDTSYERICNGPPPGTVDAEKASSGKMAVSCYPNPFNPAVCLRFTVPPQDRDRHYVLRIYDARGRLVRTLAKGRADKRGVFRKAVWTGVDNLGRRTGSGVYFYRLECGAKVKRGRMVMVK